MSKTFEIPTPINTAIKLLYINQFEWLDEPSKHLFRGQPKTGEFYVATHDLDTDTLLLLFENVNGSGITLDTRKMKVTEKEGVSWTCNIDVVGIDTLLNLLVLGKVNEGSRKIIKGYCKAKTEHSEQISKPKIASKPLSANDAADKIGNIAETIAKLEKLKSVNKPLFLGLSSLIRFTYAKFFGNGEDSMMESEIIFGERLGKQGTGALMMKYLDDYLNLIYTPLPTSPMVMNLGYMVILELAREALKELEQENNNDVK